MEINKCCERIRSLREDRDLTQAYVASLLGTTQQVYSRYENGINDIPLRHITVLCKFYNISADYILGLINEEIPIGGKTAVKK